MHFQTLSAWLSWLETLHPYTIDLGLDRIQRVAECMGLIKPAPYVITVAGTNGKGSCVALLEAIFIANGQRVGCYTSPHLLHYNERVRINNQPVTDMALCEAFAIINAKRRKISLTYFEFGTLAALYLFQQQDLDVVVLEVGMGGRLDAVNIIDSDLAVITGIDFDHMAYLGHTREAIGFEKAGIMRPMKPVVYGGKDIPNSIVQHADMINAHLYCNGVDYQYHVHTSSWQWQDAKQTVIDLPLPKLPIENAATVLQAHALLPAQLQANIATIKHCIAVTQLAGRFQQIKLANGATLVLDVAHNPQSCTLLAQQLQSQTCEGQTYALLAMLRDKDITNSLYPLLSQIEHWYLASLDVSRGGTAELLEQHLVQLHVINYRKFTTVVDAYQQVLLQATSADRIVVFGSFHTVAAIIDHVRTINS